MTPGIGGDLKPEVSLRPGEKTWAIVYLVTIFGVFAAMGVGFFTKSSTATYVAAALMAVHLVARAACRAYDSERVARRRHNRLVHALLFLVLMSLFTIVAVIKGDAFLPALGRGALIAVMAVAALLLLDVFERAVAALFFRRG